jgi:GST-like protein
LIKIIIIYSLFESGAILMYLAEKSGKLINKTKLQMNIIEPIEWLMWQMGGVGPMFGQVHHFVKYIQRKVFLRGRKVLKRGQKAVWRNGQGVLCQTSIYFR